MVLRKGLYPIDVNEVVEFEVSYWSTNKFGKKQYSGFINGDENEFWYLPTQQQLTDKLEKLPRGSLVRAQRTTKGGPKEACLYDIKVLREGPKETQTSLDEVIKPEPKTHEVIKPQPKKTHEISEPNKLIHRMSKDSNCDFDAFAFVCLMANGMMSKEEVEEEVDLKALCAKHDVDYNQL